MVRPRLVPLAEPRPKRRQGGSMRGRIWLADDWDSPETNEEIARDFWGDAWPEDAEE